jgi:hypothetical protein
MEEECIRCNSHTKLYSNHNGDQFCLKCLTRHPSLCNHCGLHKKLYEHQDDLSYCRKCLELIKY